MTRVLNIFLYFFRLLGGWVGVSTLCGVVSTWDIYGFVPLLSEFTCMERFPAQRRGPVPPAGSMNEPQAFIDWPAPLGFPTVRGGVDPGEHRFRSRDVGVVEIRRDF